METKGKQKEATSSFDYTVRQFVTTQNTFIGGFRLFMGFGDNKCWQQLQALCFKNEHQAIEAT